MDESVVIDNDRALWPVLAALRLARPLPGPLWTFAPHHYRHMWRWAVDRLSLQQLAPQPHSLRHNGASDDLLTRRRSLAEVKQKGRWHSDSRLRRYSKAARLQAELAKDPAEMVAYGNWIEQDFEQAILDSARRGAPARVMSPPGLSRRRR